MKIIVSWRPKQFQKLVLRQWLCICQFLLMLFFTTHTNLQVLASFLWTEARPLGGLSFGCWGPGCSQEVEEEETWAV